MLCIKGTCKINNLIIFICRSVFAPSCISHSILSRKDWHRIRIDDVSLPDALSCWERQIKSKIIDNTIEK